MPAHRIAALILCLLVGAVAVAGCGSDSGSEEQTDEDYVAELQDVAVAFGDGANELSTQISELDGLNLANAAALLDTFSTQVDNLADELDDVNPPEIVAQLHAQLTERLNRFAAKAEQAALVLKAGDLLGGLPAISSFAADASEVGTDLDATITDIKAELGVSQPTE